MTMLRFVVLFFVSTFCACFGGGSGEPPPLKDLQDTSETPSAQPLVTKAGDPFAPLQKATLLQKWESLERLVKDAQPLWNSGVFDFLKSTLEAGGESYHGVDAAQNANLLRNKKMIFERGIQKLKEFYEADRSTPAPEVWEYGGASALPPQKDLAHTLSKPAQRVLTSSWMDYAAITPASSSEQYVKELEPSQKGQRVQVTFVDFANAVLGGGWASYGNVQEEQMVQQCPEFAQILAISNPPNCSEGCKSFTRVGGQKRATGQWTAKPLLLKGVKCALPVRFPQATVLQPSGGVDSLSEERKFSCPYLDTFDLEQAFETNLPWKKLPSIQIVAIAAPEVKRGGGGKNFYSLPVLKDFFENVVAGFALVKAVDQEGGKETHLVSGRLGAGVFGHDLAVSLLLQEGAARLLEIPKLTWTGVGAGDVKSATGAPLDVVQKVENWLQSQKGIFSVDLFLEWIQRQQFKHAL